VEILVYIAEHNKIFGEQARLTLAGWDEASAKQLAANPLTAKEVLEYWTTPKNIRPALFDLLLENPSVPMSKLAELASTLQGERIDQMIASPRVTGSRQVLNELAGNHNLSGAQAARVQALIKGTSYEALEAERRVVQVASGPAPAAEPAKADVSPDSGHQDGAGHDWDAHIPADPETEKVVTAFMTEHAAEIAAEGDKPFQPLGGMHEEEHVEHPQAAAATAAAASAPAVVPAPAVVVPAPVPHKKPLVNPADEQRGSVLQKIAKLDIKGRIQLAMKGTKEERAILVRDGTKIVALAVLDSPKISDGEVEKFASQRNVLEAVLRAIPMKRRFVKNYAVVRNLVFNPRTPLDVGLGLMKNLLVADLRNLSGNKEVSDTIRKLALRMFKQKSEPGHKE
ncbi:MAG TPA: hypothetical protein VF447_00855, partial [Terriglobales bacterium]